MTTTQVPPPSPWMLSDGSPTIHFYKFIYNLFKSTPAAGVTNNTLQSNVSGTSAAPVANTLTAILDAVIDNVRGDIIVRGTANWQKLVLGSTGKALVSDGTDLAYALVASVASTVTLDSGAPAVITTAGGDLALRSTTGNIQVGSLSGTVTLGTATGIIKVGQNTAAAAVAANFSASRVLTIKDASGTVYFVPAASAAW